mmetsp:Transcript_41470/g.119570  ORF Transcript_41470/g.119570 Transcript_41470/m.119570 type:complete len:321 (-) Transcript_41470:298-1260(-)
MERWSAPCSRMKSSRRSVASTPAPGASSSATAASWMRRACSPCACSSAVGSSPCPWRSSSRRCTQWTAGSCACCRSRRTSWPFRNRPCRSRPAPRTTSSAASRASSAGRNPGEAHLPHPPARKRPARRGRCRHSPSRCRRSGQSAARAASRPRPGARTRRRPSSRCPACPACRPPGAAGSASSASSHRSPTAASASSLSSGRATSWCRTGRSAVAPPLATARASRCRCRSCLADDGCRWRRNKWSSGCSAASSSSTSSRSSISTGSASASANRRKTPAPPAALPQCRGRPSRWSAKKRCRLSPRPPGSTSSVTRPSRWPS